MRRGRKKVDPEPRRGLFFWRWGESARASGPSERCVGLERVVDRRAGRREAPGRRFASQADYSLIDRLEYMPPGASGRWTEQQEKTRL